MGPVAFRLCVGVAVLAAWSTAGSGQALLPSGSDHTRMLTYGGTFDSDGYHLSAEEAEVQSRTAAVIERALEPLAHDPLWHVNSIDEFRMHPDEAVPGAPARAGLMSCSYKMELDHGSQVFKDLEADAERRRQDVERIAVEAQAAAARGDLAAVRQLQQRVQMTFASPVVIVHVETNPRDVSRYLDPANKTIRVPGTDYGFVTNPDPGTMPVTTIGLGRIVKNTIDNGSFIKLRPSRLWRTQHFIELSLEGDVQLAARALNSVNLTELRHVID